MKHAVLFLATVTLTSSFAQDKAKKIKLGLGGGTNYSFSSRSGSPGKQIALPGFNAGIVVNYTLLPKLFLNGQISFVRQSTKFKSDSFFLSDSTGVPQESEEIVSRYSWIATPIHLNYILTPKLHSKFFAGVGLSPQRLMRGKNKTVINRNT